MSHLNLKRTLYGGVLVLLLAYLGRSLWEERYPPDVRVRMAINGAIEAFNAGDPTASRILTRHYRDEDGYDRDDVHDALRLMFGPAGGSFRAELREEDLNIKVSDDRANARVEVGISIWKGAAEGSPWWALRGVLDMEMRGRRWRVAGSSEINHQRRGR